MLTEENWKSDTKMIRGGPIFSVSVVMNMVDVDAADDNLVSPINSPR